MIPDAILTAFVEAKGAREATREIAKVQEQLKDCRREANLATAAVEKFGRMRGVAVLDVDAAKAKAQTAQASKVVAEFDRTNSTATLDADSVRVHMATAQATKEVRQFGREKATATVAVDSRGFAAFNTQTQQMRKTTAGLGGDLRDVGRAAKQAGDGGRDGGNGMRGFVASMGDLPGRIVLSTRLLSVMMNILLLFSPVLVGVAANLFAVVSALGPLIGLAAGAGGALVAAAQGFGVFKLATMGVLDALKEQVKNQAQAGAAAISSAASQRSAARAIQSAREGVRSATQALTDAERQHSQAVDALGPAYTAARRGLADMQASVRSAVLNEASMAAGLRDARKALDDLLKGPDPADLADAQDAVADATRGVGRAFLNLTDAQNAYNATVIDPTSTTQDIATARQNLLDAENAIGDARRESQRAAAALKELENPANSDKLADARRRVTEAENALGEARRQRIREQTDLNAAEAGGIEQSREVVAARDAVTAAEERVRDARRAVAKAQQGVREAQLSANDSMAAGAAAAANLNDKFDKLPPSAQAFVRVLQGMKPQLDSLRETAAGGFFPGATAGLKAAMGSFGSVNKVVGQTSTVLGDAARKSGELVGSPAFGRDIETIGGRNAKVLGTLGEALRHIVSALRHVLVAAGPLTQWLADVANKWALNAAQAAKAGRETGKLAAFFDKTRERAKLLGSIIANLATGLFGMGKASDATGEDLLRRFDALTERFSKWANSARGRNEIATFMRGAADAMRSIGPALGALIKAFTNFAVHVLPAYARIMRLLAPVMDEIVTIFIAWKIAATGAAIATTAWKVAAAVAAFVTGGWTTAFWSLNAAMTANPVGVVVVAIAALVAVLILAYKNSETFRNIVNAVAGALKSAAEAVIGFLSDFDAIPGKMAAAGNAILHGIVDGIKALPGLLADAATWIFNTATAAIKGYAAMWLGIGKWVVGQIVAGVKAMAGAVADAAGWLKNRVVEGVHAAVEAFKSLGSWVLNRIVDGFKTIGQALASVGGWLRNRVVDFIHMEAEGLKAVGSWLLNRIIDGFKVVTDLLSSVGGWLKNRVMDAATSVKDGFLSIGGSIMGWIVDGLKGGANLLVEFVNKIIDVINKIPGVDIDHIKKFAEGGVNGPGKGGPNGTGRLAAQGLAHGGAFARTGGIVGSPITLMGEEAPRHPEFVIPTNPAYRDRAQMLAMQAAQAVGLAEGGINQYNRQFPAHHLGEPGFRLKPDEVMAIAQQAGLPGRPFEQIAHGESQYYPGVVQRDPGDGMVGYGLWQMTPNAWGDEGRRQMQRLGGIGGMLNPFRNAEMAKYLYREAGNSFSPWYGTQYLGQAGSEDKGGGVGGILSSIGGAIGDLLSKGAGFLLDKLPGVGDLPDWLKGTGKYVLDAAGDYIKDKVGNLLSSVTGGNGGVELPDGVSGKIADVIALAQSRGFARPSIGQLTGGKHAPGSYHYQGRAADFGDAGHTVQEMLGLFNAIEQRYGSHLKELFYDKSSHYIKNGRVIRGQFGGHGDHVHAALAKGGLYGSGDGLLGSFANGTDYVPQTGPYLLHRGEQVTPADADQSKLIASNDRLSGAIERLMQTRHMDAVDALADHMGQRLGDSASRRGQTPGNPSQTAIV